MKRTVQTIGYEGSNIDGFIQALKQHGVTLLADVRAVPISRKKGFSKRALAQRLQEAGIGYEHFRQLGDPKPGRDAARAGRYQEFRRIYEKHLSLEASQDALRILADRVKREAACLMCFEREPAECHRTIIVQELSKQGIVARNIKCDLPPTNANHTACISRRNTRQGIAAA
jgi:uncharacterized protein (DUF488 family)